MIETIIPTLIAIVVSIIVTLITAVIAWLYKRKSQQEEVKMLNLEQQKAELEEQRNKLEKQKQSLIWQMEATARTKEDPLLAIITAYQGMELEMQRNLKYYLEMLEELDKQKSATLYDVNLLKDSIGPENVEIVKQMRTLRDRVVHGEIGKEEISIDKAIEYVQKAIFLSGVISSS
jgi:mannitol-specific phosphotransferase system IIBC component